jgi:hypothetical protein
LACTCVICNGKNGGDCAVCNFSFGSEIVCGAVSRDLLSYLDHLPCWKNFPSSRSNFPLSEQPSSTAGSFLEPRCYRQDALGARTHGRGTKREHQSGVCVPLLFLKESISAALKTVGFLVLWRLVCRLVSHGSCFYLSFIPL